MPYLLKNLRIKSVASVDRGAGRGTKVLIRKRDEATMHTRSLDDYAKMLAETKNISLPAAYDQILKTESGTRLYQYERDERLAKIVKNNGDTLGPLSEHGPRDSAAAADIEGLVRQFMRDNPDCGSKSAAYNAVMKTPAGRSAMARARQRFL